MKCHEIFCFDFPYIFASLAAIYLSLENRTHNFYKSNSMLCFQFIEHTQGFS